MIAPAYGGRDLARYAPLQDGDSQLLIQYGRDGKVLAFSSQNIEQTYRDSVLLSNIDGLYPSLQSYVLKPNDTAITPDEVRKRIANIGLYEIRTRNLTLDGRVQQSSRLLLRSQNGDHLAAEWLPDSSTSTVVYTPPMMMRPTKLSPGDEWESSGRVSSGQSYKASGTIVAVEEDFDFFGRPFDDCVLTILEVTLQAANGTNQQSIRREWLCSGNGLVDAEEHNRVGLEFRLVAARSTRPLTEPEDLQEILALMPPLPTLSEEDIPGLVGDIDVTEWQFGIFGKVESDLAQEFYENTFSPTWLPTNPPILLTAQSASSMIAHDTDSPIEPYYWEYNTGSMIYKEPVFDAKRGQIYFGTADNRLIALDGRGLFLWAFETNGNTASRPVIVDDLVIFGCEDANIYALNADDGQLIWKRNTGGPIVSSPILVDNLVVIGSDDGLAYAFETRSGAERWTFSTNRAIEAQIVNSQGKLLVASRDGILYAVDAASGAGLWKADTGSPLRTAPLLVNDMAVVTSEGDLLSFEISTGKNLWTNADYHYNAPLLLAGDTILAASNEGRIHFLSLKGKESAPSLSVQPIVTDNTNFHLGISQGGSDIWLGDNWGRIWRLTSP